MRSPRFYFTIGALVAVVFSAQKTVRAVDQYFNETFTGSTTINSLNSGVGLTGSTPAPLEPCITAATTTAPPSGNGTQLYACSTALNPNNGGNSGSLPDANGSGTLRLTDDETNQSGFTIFGTAVPSSGGVTVTFDIFSYGGGTGNNADGIGFLILDGTQAAPTVAGADGGSFGYAPKSGTGATDSAGIVGGYVGIAFDEHGNFSNPTEGRTGGPGLEPESVSIRGSAATSYNFMKYATVASAKAGATIDFPTSATRPNPTNVKVVFDPSGNLSVLMDFSGTSTQFVTVIPSFNVPSFFTTGTAQGALPSQLRFGFSASTGSKINFHELRNFVATSNVNPTLAIAKTAVTSPFKANAQNAYTLQVSDAVGAGPASNKITVTDTLPASETYVSATGTGWTCSAVGQLVTCTSTTAINPGTNAAPITLTVNVAPNAPVSVTNSATANTSDNSVAAGVTATITTPVTQTALLQLYKRILQIVTLGPTPSAATTPRTETFTPDPTNLTGVNGTASSEPVYPKDVITYGLYFLNVGGINAVSQSSTTAGPVFSDPLSSALTYNTGSQTSTCCTNPAVTTGVTFASATSTASPATTTLTWSLAAPLAPATSQTTAQGSIQFTATVK